MTSTLTSAEAQERYWADIWAGAAGLSESRCPRLMETDTLPAAGEGFGRTMRRLLFLLPSGVYLGDVDSAADRIAAAIGRDVVVIEPHVVGFGPEPGPDDTLKVSSACAVTVTHEMMPLGPAPHLNAALDDTTLQFAIRAAVTSAARQLKLPAPVFMAMERLDSGAGLRTRSRWRLVGWTTAADFAERSDALRQILGCSTLAATDNAGELQITYSTED